MKIYISARFGRREEAEALAVQLQGMGHTITSHWLWQTKPEMAYGEGPDAVAEFATRDIAEVLDADTLVALSEPENNPWGRGGRHVEFGVAIAFDKQLMVIGPLENLFHYMHHVLNFTTQDGFLNYMIEEAK